MASTVFVDDLKRDPDDQHAQAILKFIMHILRLFVKRTHAAQTFLSQLSGKLLENDVSIEIDDNDIITNMEWNGLEDDFKFLGPLFENGSSARDTAPIRNSIQYSSYST